MNKSNNTLRESQSINVDLGISDIKSDTAKDKKQKRGRPNTKKTTDVVESAKTDVADNLGDVTHNNLDSDNSEHKNVNTESTDDKPVTTPKVVGRSVFKKGDKIIIPDNSAREKLIKKPLFIKKTTKKVIICTNPYCAAYTSENHEGVCQYQHIEKLRSLFDVHRKQVDIIVKEHNKKSHNELNSDKRNLGDDSSEQLQRQPKFIVKKPINKTICRNGLECAGLVDDSCLRIHDPASVLCQYGNKCNREERGKKCLFKHE